MSEAYWFTIELDVERREWAVRWFMYGEEISKLSPMYYSEYEVAKANAEWTIFEERDIQEVYSDWTVVKWNHKYWVQYVDDTNRPTFRQGPYPSYLGAHWAGQEDHADTMGPETVVDVDIYDGPVVRPKSLTQMDIDEFMGVINRPGSRHSNNYVYKSFDEKWAEGIRQFFPEDV
jgi:hypothetical protein